MKTIKTSAKATMNDYFKQAKSWADDNFARIEVSRNRYQLAFFVAMGLNICALLAITVLSQLQTLVPLLVHHYDNGVTTIEPANSTNTPINKTQVESDLVRYVINRESYDASSYRAQFDLVALLSNGQVNDEYVREQSSFSKTSPVHVLGNQAYRSVHVYSINFLDNVLKNEKDFPKNHHNLAEVVFTVTDTDKASGKQTKANFNAVISWAYTKPSESPAIRWQNWDGFLVTSYHKQHRNT